MKTLFVRPNKDAWGYKPVGLSLLMALEKQCGNDVRLFDTTRYNFNTVDSNQWGVNLGAFKIAPIDRKKYPDTSLEDFEAELAEYKPDEVLVTVMSDEVDVANKLTGAALKNNFKVTWGGTHPTVAPDDCPSGVTVHQGEALESRYGIKCLDDLPFVSWDEYDRDQFARPYDGKIYRAGDHMVNWGCPYRCSYCINSRTKSKLQTYGAERIVWELEYLKDRYGLTFYKFHDEDFMNRPIKALEDFGRLYSERVSLPFVTETNPRTVTEEKARLMKDMGCVSISMGLETGNEHLRTNILKRSDTIEDVVRAFKIFNKTGIRTSSFNMLGIPYETRETYQDTIELNKRAEVQIPFIHFFYPFRGTPLRDLAIEKGFFDPETSPPYTRDRSSMTFPNLTSEDLSTMRDEFVGRIHNANL